MTQMAQCDSLHAVREQIGAEPAAAPATWRAMVAAFIQSELATHALLHPPSS